MCVVLAWLPVGPHTRHRASFLYHLFVFLFRAMFVTSCMSRPWIRDPRGRERHLLVVAGEPGRRTGRDMYVVDCRLPVWLLIWPTRTHARLMKQASSTVVSCACRDGRPSLCVDSRFADPCVGSREMYRAVVGLRERERESCGLF
eukprot:TRINITY_DN3031_c0_g1_i1.p5 TRINITY_DN3031_c0_g1~~TRINITY_DN3031_c0_g1_i1.p5  ORF type:complete len:145 (+),score=0.05 TRINITY_DN3031_c0_g1_i1:808-1242(+)